MEKLAVVQADNSYLKRDVRRNFENSNSTVQRK